MRHHSIVNRLLLLNDIILSKAKQGFKQILVTLPEL